MLRHTGPRDVGVMTAVVLALGLGEELWQSYLPAYLVALGGSAAVVGLFGSCRDLLDGAYQPPGGWIADRVGARRAIAIFTGIATAGYAAYAVAWTWPIVFLGLAASMAWKAGAFPATFALIGDSLPEGARVGAFTLQSLATRIPRVVAAPLGGLIVWRAGLVGGVRTGAAIAVALGLLALVLERRGFSPSPHPRARPTGRVGSLSPALERLLAAECFVRIGESVAASFVVLYVTGPRGVPLPIFGLLYAMQQAVSMLSYAIAARMTARVGARTLVAATFACFALFPVAVLWAPGRFGLVAAFVVGGFKEIGEPARKASIVDLCRAGSRAREVGRYYAIRNLLIVPGGILGGLLWTRSPALVFTAAASLSTIGLFVFLATRDRLAASPFSGVRGAVPRPPTP